MYSIQADYVSKLNVQYPKSTEKETTDHKPFDDNVDDEIKINNDLDDEETRIKLTMIELKAS